MKWTKLDGSETHRFFSTLEMPFLASLEDDKCAIWLQYLSTERNHRIWRENSEDSSSALVEFSESPFRVLRVVTKKHGGAQVHPSDYMSTVNFFLDEHVKDAPERTAWKDVIGSAVSKLFSRRTDQLIVE